MLNRLGALGPRFAGYHAMLIPNTEAEQAEFAQRQGALLSKLRVPTEQTQVESEVRGHWVIQYLSVPDSYDAKLLPAIKDERRQFLPSGGDDIEVARHLWHRQTSGDLDALKLRVNKDWANEFQSKFA